jgi:hypothetical protein
MCVRPHRQTKRAREPEVRQLEDLAVAVLVYPPAGVLRNKQILRLEVAV